MSERKKLASIEFVVDTDKSYEFIGEVDGAFNEKDLKDYIKKYGIEYLCKHLSFLQYQVYDAFIQLNSAKDTLNSVSVINP